MPDTALSGIAADEAAGTEYNIINQSMNQSQAPTVWDIKRLHRREDSGLANAWAIG